MAVSITTTLREYLIDGTGLEVLNGGTLKIYDGTPPANASTALSSNTLLATLTLNATAFSSFTNGVATAGAITSDSSADATGPPTFFRLLTSGATVMLQGSVGTSGSDLNLNTTSIVAGGAVSVSSLTITMPAS